MDARRKHGKGRAFQNVNVLACIAREAHVEDSYLGGVEVYVIVLLVSCQILVFVINSRSDKHHPVAVFFTAAVEAHHHTVPLEDLQIIEGLRIDKKGS